MATLYAQATGNWSSIFWNTAANGSGTNHVPAAADTLVSNTFNVTVDDNYTVTRVTNTLGGTFFLTNGITLTCTDATAGVLGDFATVAAVTNALASPNSATITAKVGGGNATNELAISFTNTGGLTINGAINAGTGAGAHGIIMSGGGTLSIVGNITVPQQANGVCYGIYVSAGAGSISIRGDVAVVAAPSFSHGIYILTNDNVNILITGNIYGGTIQSVSYGIFIVNAESLAVVTIIGNVIGGGSANITSGIVATGGTIIITGNVIGSVSSTAAGITITSPKNLTITGNVIANLGVGINSSGSGNITIIGSVIASTVVGVSSTGAGDLRIIGTLNSFAAEAISKTSGTSFLTGPFIRNPGYPRLQVIRSTQWLWDSSLVTPTYMEVYKSDGVTKYPLYTDNSFSPPAITDVRHGIVYGVGNLVGTCYVPPAANVSLGVPVDNAVGTGYISVADYTSMFETIFGLDPGMDLMAGLQAMLGLEPGENLLTELSAIETQIEVDLASIDGRLENLEDRLAEQVPEGPVVVIPNPGPSQTTVWCMCYTEEGEPEQDVEITITCLKATDDGAFDSTPQVLKSTVDGLASGTIPRGAGFTFSARRGNGKPVKFNGVDEETVELPTLLGAP